MVTDYPRVRCFELTIFVGFVWDMLAHERFSSLQRIYIQIVFISHTLLKSNQLDVRPQVAGLLPRVRFS